VHRDLYVGLMSGTSLDGVDAVLADLPAESCRLLSHAHVPFDAPLRQSLLDLSSPGNDEIERMGRIGRILAERYAEAVRQVLAGTGVAATEVRAIGCHGQTIRHRPYEGYTVQIGNPALLAERTGIAVVADFRSRDLAAGGQGAPLVPAFHAAVFGDPAEARAVINLGGIANITLLRPHAPVLGFDTGPANCLMDAWAQKHTGQSVDKGGAWAAGGKTLGPLLTRLLDEPFFRQPPPKSSGRELFNPAWLDRRLSGSEAPQDVQATLLELTSETVSRAVEAAAPAVSRLIVCGGGAFNGALVQRLCDRLAPRTVESSALHGLGPDQVESMAFAWLAKRALDGKPGNLPEVTGAAGPRVLGAIYPA
jgi:anhydro-N-acetylmuramic acid kinase